MVKSKKMSTPTIAKVHGGAFFSGCPEMIFIPEYFAQDEQLMIQTAEQFSRKEILSVIERLDNQEEGLMPSLIRKAGELGFCGVDAPEAYGGLGLSKNLAARILEYLSLNGSFSVTIGVTSGISQVGLSLFGTEEQRRKFLPSLTSGEAIGAYCLSEPNSGSDALSLSTKAEKRGSSWVLNGTKMWISNAKWAQLFLVMAKGEGDKVSAFLVERNCPGVTVSREEHKLGLKGSSTARVELENVQVPEENLLYEEGKGHYVALNALNIGRFKLSSMSLGTAREAISQAARYTKDRKQFGRPIAQFGLIRKKLAEAAARFFAAESMIYRTGAYVDQAFAEFGGDIEGNRRAAEEFAIECSACKVFSTEAQAFIVDEALQCFGGYGFTEEFPLGRIYRDARVSRIYEGTNEINRIFLAERLRRRAKEGRASLKAGGESFISELAGKAFAKWENNPLHHGAPNDPKLLDQVTLGALSDLAMLLYAEQSSHLRANQLGGIFPLIHATFQNWANYQAASAYQLAMSQPVVLPEPISIPFDSVAEAVLKKEAPL